MLKISFIHIESTFVAFYINMDDEYTDENVGDMQIMNYICTSLRFYL